MARKPRKSRPNKTSSFGRLVAYCPRCKQDKAATGHERRVCVYQHIGSDSRAGRPGARPEDSGRRTHLRRTGQQRRAKLAECLAFRRDGDVLTVTKPDRLARSTAELLSIETDLSKRGIGLVVPSMGGERLDTRNPTRAWRHRQ